MNISSPVSYKTESILCLPIFDQGKTVAVLQAINKKSEGKGFKAFTEEDEMLMEHMATQVGVILSNQLLSEQTARTHHQVVSLLEIVKSLHSNMGINSLMFTITERSPGLVDAERCTLYLVDTSRNELWSLQGAVEVRVPIDKGLVGAAAQSGQVVNIRDAWEDPRFNKEYDKQTGYRTRSVLVMPIRDNPVDHSQAPQLVGVLQLINKKSASTFSEQDVQLLQSFVDIAGTLLATSQLFQSVKKQPSQTEISLKDLKPGKVESLEDAKLRAQSMRKSKSKAQMKTFTEVDEEETGE
jgi:adenylate cyclase